MPIPVKIIPNEDKSTRKERMDSLFKHYWVAQKSHYQKYTQKKKNIIQQDFIAALFTTARTWQWPRCPSTEECGKEGAVHAQNRLLLSRKRECSGSLAESWLDLETITERGKNQKEENISHIMNVCVCNLERWYR